VGPGAGPTWERRARQRAFRHDPTAAVPIAPGRSRCRRGPPGAEAVAGERIGRAGTALTTSASARRGSGRARRASRQRAEPAGPGSSRRNLRMIPRAGPDRTRCVDPPPAPPPYGGRPISSMGIRYQHAPRGRTKVLVGWSGALQLAGGGAAATPKRGSSPNASAASEAASADASDDPSSASSRWSSRSFSAAWSRQPLAR